MSPVFSARRRADEFDSLVEALASDRLVEDARFAELLEVVGVLRSTPVPQARPAFVSDLRDRLMIAAAEELSPSPAQRLTVAPQRTRRERRIAIAVGGVAVLGATTSMAVAAQSALPGDVLYPLKRALENAETGVRVDDGAKGASMLANARGRLAEVDLLTRSDEGQDLAAIEATLEAFAEQANEASDLLLSDYATSGTEASITELQNFTAQSLAALEQLSAVLPAAAQQALVAAGELLAQIAQTAVSLCPTCSGEQIDRIPTFLVQAADDVVGSLMSPTHRSGSVVVRPGAPTQPTAGAPDGGAQPEAKAKPEKSSEAAPQETSFLQPPSGESGGGSTGEDEQDEEALSGVLGGTGSNAPTSTPGSSDGPVTGLTSPVLGVVEDVVTPSDKKTADDKK